MAQICQWEVKYLDFKITQGKWKLEAERKQAVYAIPVLTTLQQVREFLGAAGLCRIQIPGFSELARLLYQALKGEERAPLFWGSNQEKAFKTIKTKLTEAPALELTDTSQDFNMFTHKRNGVALGILTQEVGPWQRPVAYLSKLIDSDVAGWPPC
ncbi:pol protein [Lynx pardinus]|uniref:Pol protein n=1 Tax=Lynx pardinus TaxID=191816 RepID=A0A485N7F1_LYNPA|nr:pol protein [Lynx pardinus]